MSVPKKNIDLPPPPPPPLPLLHASLMTSSDAEVFPIHQTEKIVKITATHMTTNSHVLELERLVDKLFEWNSVEGAAVISVSRYVQHVPQSGPKCGLVALSMASSVCGRKAVDTSELLSLAREMELTNHGEMFSVDFMLHLVEAALPECPAKIITQQLCEPSFITEHLAAGNVFLVPYDSDRNFGPACLQGHKAHWAVLTGVLVPVPQLPFPSSHSRLLSLTPGPAALSVLHPYLPAAKILVLALQGKSRHLSAWPLAHLVASNHNLLQVDPAREAGDVKYVLPTGGICKGLCGRALLLLQCENKTNI